MEKYDIVIAGFIGSVITLFLTAVIDFLKECYKYNKDKKAMLFQRKTDAAEKAMSWLQESFDCYFLLQMALNELNNSYDEDTRIKIMDYGRHFCQLFAETNIRLNTIYLYYDFSKIERSHNTLDSTLTINNFIPEIRKMEQQELILREKGCDDYTQEIKAIQEKKIYLYNKIKEAIGVQISTIADIQKALQKDYKI